MPEQGKLPKQILEISLEPLCGSDTVLCASDDPHTLRKLIVFDEKIDSKEVNKL